MIFPTPAPMLVDRFGGLTAYTRAPARGVWVEGLARRFHQQELVVRALPAQLP